MASAPGSGSTQSLDDGRREALQALVSSLAPEGSSSSSRNLAGGDVDALTERLGHILGSGEASNVGERRNEKGELVNEDGLPIVDINEPYVEPGAHVPAPAARIAGKVPDVGPPVDTASSSEKAKRREKMDKIFDELEEEERMDAERERRTSEPIDPQVQAKLDQERKLAQRELQKKMGKALIRDFKEQREKEHQEEVRIYSQPPSALPEGSNGPAQAQKTVKPKKSVSFNVPDDEGQKPSKQKLKPAMAWGDVSVNALKSGLPKPKLKSEEALQQPMKMAVVERVPGQPSKPEIQEGDSDDESDPEVPQESLDDDDEDITPPLYGDEDDDSYGSEHDAGDLDEDEFDFSDAAQQREMALEYMRLRGSIGEEAYRAMTSHSHEGENEWDQPEVPLEATLSKPYKPSVSRFRAEREGRNLAGSSNGQSTSLGAAVLPSSEAIALQGAVQTGKLDDHDKLVGPAEDSASEGEDAENVQRSLNMLKNGIVVDSSAAQRPQSQSHSIQHAEATKPAATTPKPITTTSPTASDPSRPSRPPQIAHASSSSTHFAPAFATPRVPPDPSVLSNLIVESPSFPPPHSSDLQARKPPPPLVQEVKESTPTRGVGAGDRDTNSSSSAIRISRRNQAPGPGDIHERRAGSGAVFGSGGSEGRKRPSRFLAERMALDDPDPDDR